MARMWVAEIAPKQTVDQVFLVRRKTMPVSPSNGRAYLSLVLADRSGELDARVWDNVDKLDARFAEDDYVRAEGRTVRYQGRVQLHVKTLQRVPSSTLEPADYLPEPRAPEGALWQETQALLATVENPHLERLIQQVLRDEPFVQAYRRNPAGKSIHHARLCGLMEHNLSMCRLVDAIWRIYESSHPGLLDRDLLITAAFLHDCGKTLELSAERRFEYTDAGRLLGHVVLGYGYVSEHLQRLEGFPEDLKLHLLHLLLAHHGELEHGAPKRPKTAEAWVLHYVDILDCRVSQTADLVAALPPGGWTGYQKLYDRYLWQGHARGFAAPGDAAGPPEVGDGDGDGAGPPEATQGAVTDHAATDHAAPPGDTVEIDAQDEEAPADASAATSRSGSQP